MLSLRRTAGGLLTTVVSASVVALVGFFGGGWYLARRRRQQVTNSIVSRTAYESLIGGTPCILLPYISNLLGREIFVKMESFNPGGTGKDRAALSMIAAAESSGLLPSRSAYRDADSDLILALSLGNEDSGSDTCDDTILHKVMKGSRSGGLVVEGTSGSTGISLAALALSKGHGCLTILPDDQASEKRVLLEALGAVVHVVPTASIANPLHYVNVARHLTERAVKLGIQAVFINQFENRSNFQTHYDTTGPEIWKQCRPDAFVMSAGTGGTVSGVSKYLKSQSNCRTVLVDPKGSVLYSKIEHGVAFTTQQRERELLRHRYDSIAEGIGLDRITANMSQGLPFIDSAIAVSDQEAVDMAHFILDNEGLMIGSSSAMNVVGAIRTALKMSPQSRVCTIICDSGQRHVTRFWNREFILSRGLQWPRDKESVLPECLQESGFNCVQIR